VQILFSQYRGRERFSQRRQSLAPIFTLITGIITQVTIGLSRGLKLETDSDH
jgi:hypothetical protein